MYGYPRVVFDLNKMQFIFPAGVRPYGPFKISLVFNGININEELEKVKFENYVLLILHAETEDKWERLQIQAAIYDLEVQKNILLQNVLRYLQQFWFDLEEMDYNIRCPDCGRPYFINYGNCFGEEEEEYEEEEQYEEEDQYEDEEEYEEEEQYEEEYEEDEDEEEPEEDEDDKGKKDLLIPRMDRCTSAAG